MFPDRELDPEEELSRVRQACAQALTIAPEHLPALHQTALAELALARYRAAQGKDARPEFVCAIEAFEATIRKNPRCGEAAINLGAACLDLGRLLHELREDPEPLYRRALVALERAEQLLPDLPEAFANQISVWRQLGELRLRRRQDPSAEFDAVRKYAERVLALQPRSVAGLLGRAGGLAGRAHTATRRGENAQENYAAAAAAFKQALAPALGLRRAEVLHDSALCDQTRGDLLAERGQDATGAYRQALAGYDEALAVQPNRVDAWNNRSNVCLMLARAAKARGEDATPWIQDGMRGFERILALHPGDRVARFNRATASGMLAAEQQRQGRDPRPGYQQAAAEIEELSALAPGDAAIPSNLGMLAQNAGDYLLALGQDPTASYARAVAHYDHSLALLSGQVEVLVSRATAYQILGDLRRARGEDPAAEYRQALTDYQDALAVDPRTWQAQVNRGILLEALERPVEALAAFEAALAVVGDALPMIRTLIARARVAACADEEAAWVHRIRDANRALLRGESTIAQTAFARGLAEAGPEADDTPTARAARMIAHYNLACTDAKIRPGAAPPDAPTRAAALESALGHLEYAVRLGWADAAQVEADADLSALHGDPRWGQLLDRLRAGRK